MNIRPFLWLAAIILVPCLSQAQTDYSALYNDLPVSLAQPDAPAIPDRRACLTDFGGVADGLTLNTEAFARAISHLSEHGGGHLDVPAGLWLTGPIEMKSSIDIHLAEGALLLFSPDKSLYLDPKGGQRVLPGIRAQKQSDISITGRGIIDGGGQHWRPVKRSKVSDVEWKQYKQLGGVEQKDGSLWYPWNAKAGYANIADSPEKQEHMRNDLIRLVGCDQVLIEGVTVQNAPKFHVHPITCRNVIIDGITVRCPWNAQNGDAIDLSDCHRALITNCTIDAGDDGLCLKSGPSKPGNLCNGCEDILISGCTVFHAHGGFVLGSETVSGMRRVVVKDCLMVGTDTGLRFKSGLGRGGETEDIYINNVVMADIGGEAIIFQCDYADKPAGGAAAPTPETATEVPHFKGIHISNLTCRGCKTAISAHGLEGLDCVSDIDVSHSTIVYTHTATDIDPETTSITLTDVNIVEAAARAGSSGE